MAGNLAMDRADWKVDISHCPLSWPLPAGHSLWNDVVVLIAKRELEAELIFNSADWES